ncbi:MAG: hypothetical protein F6K47_28125 [Symploca sp. SIO2E6]|nr:hypothetical protein [Symploca sp. SIO2E6]
MNSQDNQDQDLQRREQELKAREEALRLRELESEINQPPLYHTSKEPPPEKSKKRWVSKLIRTGQFLGIVIVVIIAVRVAVQLAYLVMIGAIAWVVFKIFVDKGRS